MKSVTTLLCLTTATTLLAAPAVTPALPEVLRVAGEYVRHFEAEFAMVISDEDYEQRLIGRASDPPVVRRTRAEMVSQWLPNERVWLTVRNVLEADGRPVPGSPGLLGNVLAAPADARVGRLRRVLDANAQFNLGRTTRTFNYPTFVLAYLDPALQPRFEFSTGGTERRRGAEIVKVAFAERERPTLIQGDGADRVSRGAIWLRASDGAPVKTRLELSMRRGDGNSYATVEVDYEPNDELRLSLPVGMREQYTEMRGGATVETLSANATYTNFRRFETSARILPAPAESVGPR